jgi:hypothetical protein
MAGDMIPDTWTWEAMATGLQQFWEAPLIATAFAILLGLGVAFKVLRMMRYLLRLGGPRDVAGSADKMVDRSARYD